MFGRVAARGATIIGCSIDRLCRSLLAVITPVLVPVRVPVRFPHMTKQANTAMKSWRAWLAGERRRGPREERKACLNPLAPRPWAAQHVGSVAIRPDAGERPLLSLKIGIIQGTKCHSANYVTVPAEGRVIAIARGQDQGVEVSSRGDGVGQRGGTPNDKTARTLHATRALALIPMERETVGAAPGQQANTRGSRHCRGCSVSSWRAGAAPHGLCPSSDDS